jgi:hypothetical protein
MFSFRSDKTGFLVTIILLALLAAAVILTGVAFALDWDKWLVKVVWGTWWVLCIITVLVRLAIFRWQMIRAAPQNPPTPPSPGAGPTPPKTDPGPTPGRAGD